MKLAATIEHVFSSRAKPAQVRLADEVIQLDDDVEDALWFSGRDWHELTWQNWQEHSDAIFFFDPEAFAYYLPSILLLSAQNPNESLNVAHSRSWNSIVLQTRKDGRRVLCVASLD